MLKSITIKDFKCHEDYNTFNFNGLTFLSGSNNSGKSSVLQSILLLAQSNLNNSKPTLLLNTEKYKFGTFTDILNKNKSIKEPLEFSLELQNNNYDFFRVSLEYKNPILYENFNNKNIAVLSRIIIDFNNKENNTNNKIEMILKNNDNDDSKENDIYQFILNGENIEQTKLRIWGFTLMPFFFKSIETVDSLLDIRRCLSAFNTRNVKFLRAYREEAKILYDITGDDSNDIGISGECTAEVLYRNMTANSKVFFGDSEDFTNLFNYWCSRILGENYKINPDEFANFYKLKVEEKNISDEKKINDFDITQVGFGFSQVIPIITMVLLSSEKDILLIENPEVHLHPKLQANLAELFVFATKHNRKIIIETHSEHIINRTRLLVKNSKEEDNLKDKINIYFFEKCFEDNESFVKSEEIFIDKDGKISSWPKNFFDQSYNDSIGLISNE